MIWRTNKPRAIVYFVLSFFLSYLLIFFSFYTFFPDIQNNILLPLIKTEIALLDPTSQLRSLEPAQKQILGKIHFEIALIRHPGGSSSVAPGLLVQQAYFTLRDNVLLLCLMLALAVSWLGLPLAQKLKALCIVLATWLCLFCLLIPFTLLNDGVPPLGVRLTLISWWNAFLTHKGNIILTLLFFVGNMYMMYLLSLKSRAGKSNPHTQDPNTRDIATNQ